MTSRAFSAGYGLTTETPPLQQLAELKGYTLSSLVTEIDVVERPALQALASGLRPRDEVLALNLATFGATLQEAEVNISRLLVAGLQVRLLREDFVLGEAPSTEPMRMLRSALALTKASDQNQWRTLTSNAAARNGFRKGRPRVLNEESVWALRASGLSATAISQELGVARATIYRYLRRLENEPVGPQRRAARDLAGRSTAAFQLPDYPPARARGRPRVLEDRELQEMRAAGLSPRELAAALNVSVRSVYRRLQRLRS